MRYSLDESGLTLVEVIVAATLMTLVICGALLLYERGVRSWVWTEQNTEVVDNLRIAVDKIVYELRGARQIMNPRVEETGNTILEFVDASGETIKYYLHNKALRRTHDNQPVTTDVVAAVYFSRPSTALVKIRLVGKGVKTGVKTGEVSVRTAVYLRSL